MKFVSKTSEKGLHIKPAELVLGSFPNETGVNIHVENSAIVILKSKMNAKELVSAAYALHVLASKLIDHIWNVCGDCCDCSNRCPFQEIDEFDDDITLPNYLRKEAGIEEGAKLWANVDAEAGSVTISAVDDDYAILDIPPAMLDLLIDCNICLGELEDMLNSDEVVYEG